MHDASATGFLRLRFLVSVSVFSWTSSAPLSSFAWAFPLFSEPFPCPALSSSEGKACASEMDIFGDGPSLVFRHNNVRDRASGLATVIDKKNQIDGSKAKPGDITIQQYHRGFSTSAFDVTIAHPLRQKYKELGQCGSRGCSRQEAAKSLAVCEKEGIHSVPISRLEAQQSLP